MPPVEVESKKGLEVRWAREGDIPWIEAELLEFSQAIGTKYPLFPLGETFRRETLLKLMADHLFLVAETPRSSLPVGLIAGVVVPHALNPAILMLHEMFWWVTPEHRGSRAGLVLLDAFVGWGKENCQWVYFSIHHTTKVSSRAMLRRGFHEEQTQYLLEV